MTAGMMHRGQHSLCPEDEAPEPLYDVGDIVVFLHTRGIFRKETRQLAGRIVEREYGNHGFPDLSCEWLYTVGETVEGQYFKWEQDILGIYEE